MLYPTMILICNYIFDPIILLREPLEQSEDAGNEGQAGNSRR